MRRSALWSIVWTVSIVLCGWRWVEGRVRLPPAPPASASSAASVIKLHAADDRREVRLQPGQWLAVELPATSASGYRCWLQDPAAQVLSIEQEPARAALTHAWVFRAVRGGQGQLRFDCHQELSGGPSRQFEYRIRID